VSGHYWTIRFFEKIRITTSGDDDVQAFPQFDILNCGGNIRLLPSFYINV
jgi:hypothetical protein